MRICQTLITAAISVALAGCTVAASEEGETEMPTVAKPGENGYIKGELIYSLDDKPTPQCHASVRSLIAADSAATCPDVQLTATNDRCQYVTQPPRPAPLTVPSPSPFLSP
jgi:hypothetical protein